MKYRNKLFASILVTSIVLGTAIPAAFAEQEQIALEDGMYTDANTNNEEVFVDDSVLTDGNIDADQTAIYSEEITGNEITSDAELPAVSTTANPKDTYVTGLEEPVLLETQSSGSGIIYGAGMDNEDPTQGDTRWHPVSITSYDVDCNIDPDFYGNGSFFTFRSPTGITEEKEIPLLFTLDEEKFLNNAWKVTGVKSYFTAVLKTQAYTPPVLITGLDDPVDFSKAEEYFFTIVDSSNIKDKYEEGDIRYVPEDIEYEYDWINIELVSTDEKTNSYKYRISLPEELERTFNTYLRVILCENVYINGRWVAQEAGAKKLAGKEFVVIGTFGPEKPIDIPVVTPDPLVPTPAPHDSPIVANINNSIVYGLDKPLLLTPGTFYDFSVTGAGTENTNPIEWDTRWVPVYWRMRSGTTKQTSWKIGAVNGISDSREIYINIYLIEQVYTNGSWVSTGQEGSIGATVKTQAYDPIITPTPTPVPVPKAPITGLKEMSIGKMKMQAANKGTQVDGYQFKWSLDSSFNTGVKSASSTKHYLFRSGLIGGKTYYVKARTFKIINGKKVYSSWSGTKSLKLNILPPKPAISSLKKNGTGFTVKWKAVSGVGGYQIRYSTASNFSLKKTASVTGASKTSWTKKNLVKGQTYYVSVRSYKVAADGTKYYSKWSVSKSIVIK